MDNKSQQKVIAAGFTIIRKDDTPNIRIKFKGDGGHEWKTFEKYETKAARDRAFDELLEDEHIISD